MTNKNSVILLFLASLLSFSASVNAVVVGWGAGTVNEIASYCPSFCSTQNNGTFTNNSDGGAFESSASSELSTGSGDSEAESTLSGTSFTPTLRAYSESQTSLGGAFALAVGAQGYTYGGTGETITLDLNLSANLFEPGGARSQAVARVLVLFANDLEFTTSRAALVPEGGAPDFIEKLLSVDTGINTIATEVTDTDSITFDVSLGDEFLVWASLETRAYRGASTDARNTLTMDFFGATGNLIEDPTILMPEAMAGVGVVPLPAGVWLFLSGIGIIAGLSRRGKQFPPS